MYIGIISKRMSKAKKFYVVWEGNNPGIYNSWTECQLQIKGFPGAKYKSFKSLVEAKNAYGDNYSEHYKTGTKSSKKVTSWDQSVIIKNSISVDAACSGNPGIMEYRGVDTYSQVEHFKQGPFPQGTNNVGEFLAIIHGLAWLKQKKDTTTTIYTDSRTAMAWVRNKKVKTMLKKTAKNDILFELIDRGIKWLKTNTYRNPIIKWETKSWGEIPADFGRK